MLTVRWTRFVGISVRIIAYRNMISQLISHLFKMMIEEIKKRCSRCGELYDIPNIRQSEAREKLIEFYPCMHCGYEKNCSGDKSGRCRDCAIPFAMIDHHAKGRCKRCSMRFLRQENATKQGQVVRM